MVSGLNNRHSTTDHLENGSGTGGDNDHSFTTSPTYENSVVKQEVLINNNIDHLPTETTTYEQNVRKRFSVKTLEVVK